MHTATGSSSSLVERMIGVATLKRATFREIERDVDATTQALIVVVIAAVAGAIGGAGSGSDGVIGGAVASVLGWIVFSVIAFFVGTRLFGTPQTDVSLGQVLRLIGFAQTPKILGALAFIPLVGWIFGVVAAIWFVIVAIYALREAFEFQTDRAVITGIVALIAWGIVIAIIVLVLGAGAAFLDWLF